MTHDQTIAANAPLRLSDLPTLAVVRLNGADAVVLSSTGTGDFRVWMAGTITTYPDETPVRLVHDEVAQTEVLSNAISYFAAFAETAEHAYVAATASHTATLNAIRCYAINAHRDGDICRGGLDDFLEAFDLPAYDPRTRVTYELVGSCQVLGTDPQDVEDGAREQLHPSLVDLAGVLPESVESTVTVHQVKRAERTDGQQAFIVEFLLSGHYDTSQTDAYYAENTCRRNLRPSLGEASPVKPGSITWTFQQLDCELVY